MFSSIWYLINFWSSNVLLLPISTLGWIQEWTQSLSWRSPGNIHILYNNLYHNHIFSPEQCEDECDRQDDLRRVQDRGRVRGVRQVRRDHRTHLDRGRVAGGSQFQSLIIFRTWNLTIWKIYFCIFYFCYETSTFTKHSFEESNYLIIYNHLTIFNHNQ